MNYFSKADKNEIIKRALREDIGKRDITTTTIIPKDKYVKAILLAKEDCVICGLEIARKVFHAQDKNIKFKPHISDGQRIKKGKIIKIRKNFFYYFILIYTYFTYNNTFIF